MAVIVVVVTDVAAVVETVVRVTDVAVVVETVVRVTDVTAVVETVVRVTDVAVAVPVYVVDETVTVVDVVVQPCSSLPSSQSGAPPSHTSFLRTHWSLLAHMK